MSGTGAAAITELSQQPSALADSNGYWCAMPARELVVEAQARIREWAQANDGSGRTWRWHQSYLTYYTIDSGIWSPASGSAVRTGGEMGELVTIRVNEARNFASHVINLVTSDVLSYSPVAHDSGHAATEQSDLARKLLAWCVREKNLSRLRYRSAEIAFVFDSAYVYTGWDATSGPEGKERVELGPDGQPTVVPGPRLGDPKVEVMEPWNVAYDVRRDTHERDWYLLRRWRNRWDVIAEHPELRDAIMNLRTRDALERGVASPWQAAAQMKSDDVCVWEFLHRPSPTLPDGRRCVFLDADSVLSDGPLLYEQLPVREVRVADMIDTAMGYTPFYDILPLAVVYDAAWSTFLSVMDQGYGNWTIPEQSDFTSIEGLVGGGKVVLYKADPNLPDGGRPQRLDPHEVPDTIYKVMQAAPSAMGRIVSVNETVRGQPPDNVKTASGAALEVEQSAAFWTPLRQRLVSAWEGVGSDILACFAKFADQERAIDVEGDEKSAERIAFTGNDLGGLRKVRVDQGGPANDGPAARRATLEFLLKAFPGRLSADDTIEFLRTGLLDPIYDDEAAEDALIDSENEALAAYSGEVPDQADADSMHVFTTQIGAIAPVDPTDDHLRHAKKHARPLRNPNTRKNPAAVAALHAHLAMHMQFLSGAGMTGAGGPPPPQPGPHPGGGPPPPPGAPGPNAPQQVQAASPPKPPAGAPPTPQAAPQTPVPR